MSIVLKPQVTLDDFKVFDEMAEQRRAVARAIDLGQPMPYSFKVKANRAKALRKTMTAQRWDMLMALQSGARTFAELAAAQQRPVGAVESDFARLKKFGIVQMVTEAGRKMVRLAPGQFLTPQQSAATARPCCRPGR
jgi:predicted transcriptional regulator